MADPRIGCHTWGFFQDDNSDINAQTQIGSDNSTSETHALDTNLQIRIGTWNDTSANFNDQVKLQYQVDGGGWFDVNGSSSYVRSSAGNGLEGTSTCSTQLLSSYSTYSWENDGQFDETDGAVASAAHAKETFWEDQWCVQLRSADLSGGETIEFRTRAVGTATYIDPGTFPQITAAAFSSSAQADGVASTTATAVAIRYGTAQADGAATTTATASIVGAGLNLTGFRFRAHGGIQDADGVALNADTGWEAALNTNVTTDYWDREFRLRTLIENGTASTVTDGYELWYRIDSGGGFGAWAVVPNDSAPWGTGNPDNPEVCLAPSNQSIDGVATTQLIGTGTFVAGEGVSSEPTASISLDAGEETEIEWCILLRKLGVNVSTVFGYNDGTVYQFQVRYDDGTEIDGHDFTPQVTLDSANGIIGGTYSETPNRALVNVAGTLYVLCEFSDADARLVMNKSTDGGTTWEVLDQTNGPPVADDDMESVDMVWDQANNKLRIAWIANTTPVYSEFYTEGHGTTPDTWESSGGDAVTEEIYGSLDPSNYTLSGQGIALAHNTSDDSVIAFMQQSDANRAWVIYSERADAALGSGSWSVTPGVLDTTAVTNNDHYLGFVCAVDASDRTHVFYTYVDTSGGTTDAYHVWFNSSNVKQGRTQVNDNALGYASSGELYRHPFSQAVIYDDGGTETIAILYGGTGAACHAYFTQTPTGSISFIADQQVTDSAEVDRDGGATGGSGQVMMDLAYDSLKDEHIAYWVESTNQDLRRDIRSSAGSWGTDAAAESAAALINYVRAVTFVQGNTTYVGLYLDDQPQGGGTGGGRLKAVTLGVTLGSTQADGAAAVTATGALLEAGLEGSAQADGVASTTVTATAVRSVSTQADGSAATTASLVAIRYASTQADGTAATTVSGTVLKHFATQSDGLASTAVTANAIRSLSTQSDGAASISATASGGGLVSGSAAAAGIAAATATVTAVHSISVQADGTAASSATLGATRLVSTASAGTATATATLVAIRYGTAQSDGSATTTVTINAIRDISATAAGSASVTATGTSTGATFIQIIDSPFVAVGGEVTTTQLTPPVGMTAGDFSAGRIEDDQNPTASVAANTDGYTEIEFSLRASPGSENKTWKFRLTLSGTPIDSAVTPKVTVGAATAQADGTATVTATGSTLGFAYASAQTDGVATTTVTADAIRGVSTQADGAATTAVTITAVRSLTTQSDGVATVTASGSVIGLQVASAQADGSSTVAASANAIRGVTVQADGVSTVTATASAGAVLQGSAQADGLSTVTASPVAIRLAASQADGSSTTTVTINAVYALTTQADGIAAVTANLLGVISADAAGQSTTTVTIAAIRGAAAQSAGTAIVTASANAIRGSAVQADGVSTTSATMAAGGLVAGSAQSDGVSTATASLVAIRYADAAVAGTAAVTANAHLLKPAASASQGSSTTLATANRIAFVEVQSDGQGAATVELYAIYSRTARADGLATVTAVARVAVGEIIALGKYEPEHDTALAEMGLATGYAPEHADALEETGRATGFERDHAGALSDLRDAGV